MAFHEPGQAAFQVLDLLGELLDSVGQQTQGDAGGSQHRLLTVLVVLAVLGEPCAGTGGIDSADRFRVLPLGSRQ